MACTQNPFIAYIDLLIASHTENPSISYTDLMDTNPFELVGEQYDVCPSDCGDFAFIGPVQKVDGSDPLAACFSMLAQNFPTGCCENYDISDMEAVVSLSLPIISNDNYVSELCCNTFNDCATTFTNIVQKYLFSDSSGFFDQYVGGIHEYGTISGSSSLCILNSKILAFSDADKLDFLNGFFTLGGFVMFNAGSGDIYAGTTEGFLNWY